MLDTRSFGWTLRQIHRPSLIYFCDFSGTLGPANRSNPARGNETPSASILKAAVTDQVKQA